MSANGQNDESAPPPEHEAGSGLAPAAGGTARRRRRALLGLPAALLLVLLLAAGTLAWTLATASGSAWLLARVPGLQVEAPEGSLLGDFSARSLRWKSAALNVDVQGLAWQGLALAWDWGHGQWGRLKLHSLRAERLSVSWPASDAPASPPADLRLPIGLDLEALHIGELHLAALGGTPIKEIDAALVLGLQGGKAHRLQLNSLQWDGLSLAGRLGVQSGGDMAVDAALTLHALDTLQANLSLQGALAAPQLQVDAERGGQHLKASAGLRPFAAWPLADAALSLADFDLSALHGALPRTALSGQASLEASAWDRPARLRAELSNAQAGLWDRQRLPIHQLRLDLQARPDQLNSIDDLEQLQVNALEARLGSAEASAGQITAEGKGLALSARLSGLRTTALDRRLPELRLSGSLGLRGRLAATAGPPSVAAAASAPPAPAEGPQLAVEARLEGDWRLPSPGAALQPLRLQLRAGLDGAGLSLQQAQLQAGAARIDLKGQVLRGAAGWRTELQGLVQDFDPRMLWAGDGLPAWQRGPHSLNGRLEARLSQGKALWPSGRAELTLTPSTLAGVKLDGRIDYLADDDTAAPGLKAELRLADSQLRLTGENLTQDQPLVKAELLAPRLASLGPLLQLWAPQAQWSGSLQTSFSVQGRREGTSDGPPRWQFASTGEARAQGIQLKGWPGLASTALQSAQLAWRADTQAQAPLALHAELGRLSLAGGQLNRLLLDLQGSWAGHKIQLEAQGHLPTPEGLAPVIGEGALAGNTMLTLQGTLSESPWTALRDVSALDWRLQADELLLRPEQPQRPALVAARDLRLDLRLDPVAGLQRAELAPGRVELAGAGLGWGRLLWEPALRAGLPARLQAELSLEPLAVAPLLARWQPEFGWGGDLVMGGQLHLRSAPQVEIDLELKRVSGDLLVRDDTGPQSLGLSELRLALLAHDGVWHFTQGIAGSTLGVLGGAITAHASPQVLWPADDARLEGVMTARVENLGTWGGWVPAGWRLAGRIDAGLSLAGRLGAPEIIGQAEGSGIAVRNPLLGVNVRDGAFALSLDGPTARLKSFKASAGAGSLSASGEASLAAPARASIQLQAEKFALLSRVDRRLIGSGRAQLELKGADLKLDGRFGIDEGLFDFSRADAPSLDADVQVLRPDRAPPEAGPALPRRERKIDVRLALDLGRQLKLRGHGLETQLRGELVLTHDGGTPALRGTLSTLGGTFDAYGQKLEIEKGEISFAGVIDNPRLDVLAVRPNIDARVGVTLTGTALNPRIKLFSEPEMADTDKLSWLVLGRAPEGLGRADTALLQRAALALLSGSGEGFSGRLLKNLGLDEFSVGQAADDTRGTVVRLGKQISRRLYLGYERGLNATSGNWQLIYRIARRFTLRAQSGDENAVDLIWQWKWE